MDRSAVKIVKRTKRPDQKWVKKGSVSKCKQTNGVVETSITDWLTHNGYPLSIILNNSKIFENKNINKITDFSKINDDELGDMLNSLEISDSVQKSRLISDIMNCMLKFKHGVYDSNRLVSEPRPEKKADVIDTDGKFNTELKYLGLHKVVILDYLYHKRIKQKPKIQMDKNGEQNYLAQVSIFVPDEITGFSIGANAVSAEHYAYKNLYDKLIGPENLVDKKTFNGLIRKYQIIKNPINRNGGNYKLWIYFHGFKQFKRSSEYEKAQYFFNKNMDDATGGKDKWVNMYIEKQAIWFHGFYYLFCDEIESAKDVYNMIVVENKDLIFVWMKSYNSRKEFYGNIMQYGLSKALTILKIH